MPYVPLRPRIVAVVVGGLSLAGAAAPAAVVAPAVASPVTVVAPAPAAPAVDASGPPAPAPLRERPGRALTGLLAVVATVSVLGVGAALIRIIHAQRPPPGPGGS